MCANREPDQAWRWSSLHPHFFLTAYCDGRLLSRGGAGLSPVPVCHVPSSLLAATRQQAFLFPCPEATFSPILVPSYTRFTSIRTFNTGIHLGILVLIPPRPFLYGRLRYLGTWARAYSSTSLPRICVTPRNLRCYIQARASTCAGITRYRQLDRCSWTQTTYPSPAVSSRDTCPRTTRLHTESETTYETRPRTSNDETTT